MYIYFPYVSHIYPALVPRVNTIADDNTRKQSPNWSTISYLIKLKALSSSYYTDDTRPPVILASSHTSIYRHTDRHGQTERERERERERRRRERST